MPSGYGDPIRWWSRFDGRRVALVDLRTGGRFTYSDLDALIDRWVHVLREQFNASADSRVALLMGNRMESVAIFFACVRLRSLFIPLNWRLSPAELGEIIGDARPDVVISEERFCFDQMTAKELRTIDVDHDAPALLASGPGEFVSADTVVDGEDPAMVIYTSGSTGKPKGAVLSHRQLLFNAIATTTAWELGPDDVAPITTPFFHVGGWNVFATPLWLRGGTVVLVDQFDPSTFLGTLAAEGCTVALCVPTQLTMLLESPEFGREIPSLRWLITGGAPCPQAVADRVRSGGYPLRLGYGLTECGPNCFAMTTEESFANYGSVGRPVPFLEMKLVDDSLSEVGDGKTGELLLKGPQLFSGYLDAPDRTREVMTTDGWLRTGDLARRDANGGWWICGRRKEMFISGGENVFPGEVEAVLLEMPELSEVVVAGVDDPLWGEVGRAFVVTREADSVSEDAILEFARKRLARYKVPKSVVFMAEIPRLGSGKPDRRRLKQMVPPALGTISSVES